MSLHGRDVTGVSAREREVGFVFQHYALFRHMTVAHNIEFALQVRGVRAAERRARRQEDALTARGEEARHAARNEAGQEPEGLHLASAHGALGIEVEDLESLDGDDRQRLQERRERTREKLRTLLRDGKLEERSVEVEVTQSPPIENMMIPMGGGEGRRAGGRDPVSPWGVLSKGGKTRKRRKLSSKHIIRRRTK